LRNAPEFVAKALWAVGLTEHATFNIQRCETTAPIIRQLRVKLASLFPREFGFSRFIAQIFLRL